MKKSEINAKITRTLLDKLFNAEMKVLNIVNKHLPVIMRVSELNTTEPERTDCLEILKMLYIKQNVRLDDKQRYELTNAYILIHAIIDNVKKGANIRTFINYVNKNVIQHTNAVESVK